MSGQTAAFAARWGFDPASPRLRAALTHRSAAAAAIGESNERLEFLGDALIGAIVAGYLLDALPPDTNVGALSRARIQIVRAETLAAAARALGVPDLLAVGQGERKENRHNHDSLLADAFEALIAALFLDRGAEAAERFVRATLAGPLAAVVAAPPPPDPKTRLQEILQASGRGLPRYRLVRESGSGHDRHFVVEVSAMSGEILAFGEGASKRIAETEAARKALNVMVSAVD